MKYYYLTILIVDISMSVACNNSTEKKETTQDSAEAQVQSIGGNKDKNGCLTGAGLTWSQLRNDCIQVFSEGIRLNPLKIDSNEAIISTFVLPNADSSAYELFLPTDEETIILKYEGNNVYKLEKYSYNSKTKELSIEDAVIYKAD